jgi:hypothetical protein
MYDNYDLEKEVIKDAGVDFVAAKVPKMEVRLLGGPVRRRPWPPPCASALLAAAP